MEFCRGSMLASIRLQPARCARMQCTTVFSTAGIERVASAYAVHLLMLICLITCGTACLNSGSKRTRVSRSHCHLLGCFSRALLSC